MKTILMCLEVFFARMLDVAIGSVRTIFLVKGKNLLACIFSFIEILIWFYVAREILTAKDLNILVILSYAGGYSFGTYVGGLINKYFVKGELTAFVVTSLENENMIQELKDSGYGVTTISMEDQKLTLLLEFKKKNLKNLKSVIKSIDKNAFFFFY